MLEFLGYCILFNLVVAVIRSIGNSLATSECKCGGNCCRLRKEDWKNVAWAALAFYVVVGIGYEIGIAYPPNF